MTTPPVGLQLFTVRDALKKDLAGTIEKVAEVGFAGVEPFGLNPQGAGELKELLDRFELEVPSVHVPMPVGERQEEVIDTVLTLGSPRLVSGFGRGEFRDLESVARCSELFNEAHQASAARGLSFGIHNHWWEYEPLEGRYPYREMLEQLDPGIFFELDVYWVKTAGLDPVAVLSELGERTPILHVKDGPAVKGQPMVAVGRGALDIEGIIASNEANTEWLMVELDECATDMIAAVSESFEFLTRNGLARGSLEDSLGGQD
ncbi:MAG: sugar phosphate isomerase/epimerase [Trueperaceae bacterium]